MKKVCWFTFSSNIFDLGNHFRMCFCQCSCPITACCYIKLKLKPYSLIAWFSMALSSSEPLVFVIGEAEKNVSSYLHHVQVVYCCKVLVMWAVHVHSTPPETEMKSQPGLHLPLISYNPIFVYVLPFDVKFTYDEAQNSYVNSQQVLINV